MKRFASALALVLIVFGTILFFAPRDLARVTRAGYQNMTAPLRDAVQKYEREAIIRYAEAADNTTNYHETMAR